MKILQVPANAGYGGMPLHVLALARGLVERGHEVHVLSLSDGPLVSGYRDAGLKVTVAPMLGRRVHRDPLIAFKTVRFIRSVISGFEPDVVHTHGPRASCFTGASLLFRRQPAMVATAHGSFSQFSAGDAGEFSKFQCWLRDHQYRSFDKFMGHAANRVIAVSESTRNDLVEVLGLPDRKVTIVRNGIEEHLTDAKTKASLRQEFNCGPGDKLVVYVGRVAFHKGAVFLAQAAGSVLSAMPQARFVIVGEGPMEAELYRLAKTDPYKDRFMLTGRRNDAREIIAAADLLVLPSLSEGLPLTLLEAAMTGTPMIASRVGGVPEVVIDNQTGLLTPVRDSKALADAVTSLLLDDSRRESMGVAARKLWGQRFTISQMLDKIEDIYTEVAQGR